MGITRTATLDTLLDGFIDYAGLFPPAALDMLPAVQEYQRARNSADRPALGRFVVPAARLDEFAVAVSGLTSARAWRLSALLGEDVPADLRRIAAANARFGADGTQHEVDCVELRAATPAQVADRLALIPSAFARFVEFPVQERPDAFLDAIAEAGACAKIRMGGITASAFPNAGEVARFLEACIARRIPFKATAGLHHPLRGAYRLTYAPDADLAGMYGYLNLLLAAALVRSGGSDDDVHALLLEPDAAALHVTDEAIVWRAHRFSHSQLAELRRATLLGIGSCSFAEPLDDLRRLRLA